MPKVLRLHSFEGVSGLQIDELPLVEPKGSEVRIQVEAFALNWGDFVLLPAATSSAGIAAVNIVRKQGGKSIGTTRSADNINFLLNEVGCDYVIDTSKDSIGTKVLEITENKGCRVIYDPVGGPLMMDYADAMGMQCQIFLYGSITKSPTVLPEIKMAMADAVLRSYTMYHHMWDPAEVERGRKYVYDGIASGVFKAIVDRVYDEFTMENVLDALKYQEEGVGRRGKIVIRTQHK